MRTPRVVTIALAVLFTLCAPLATAATIVSTFPHTPGGGWSVVGPQEPLGQRESDLACEFTIPPGANYDEILADVALDNWWGTKSTDVMIRATDWTEYPPRPGELLATQTVFAPASSGIVSVSFPGTVVLYADSMYWIALSTPADGLQSWNWAVELYDYWVSYKSRSEPWTTQWGQYCGFAIYGTASQVDVPLADGAGPLRLTSRPNPFVARATLAYRLDEEQTVTLRVLDVGGRVVRTCVAGERQGPGEHLAVWNGETTSGARVGPGVYFAVLAAGTQVRTHRLVRLD